MESGLRAFMAARELWNIENNYNPAQTVVDVSADTMVLKA
jgi:hypothetical protein